MGGARAGARGRGKQAWPANAPCRGTSLGIASRAWPGRGNAGCVVQAAQQPHVKPQPSAAPLVQMGGRLTTGSAPTTARAVCPSCATVSVPVWSRTRAKTSPGCRNSSATSMPWPTMPPGLSRRSRIQPVAPSACGTIGAAAGRGGGRRVVAAADAGLGAWGPRRRLSLGCEQSSPVQATGLSAGLPACLVQRARITHMQRSDNDGQGRTRMQRNKHTH